MNNGYNANFYAIISCLVAKSCPTLWYPMTCSRPGFPVLHHLPELAQTHVHWIRCHPTISSSVIPFSSCLQSSSAPGSFPIRLFISGGQSIGASASASSPHEYSGMISFRIDWFDFLAVQGTFKSLLWHHNSNASILQCSAFFVVQLSHLYMATGKNIALTL